MPSPTPKNASNLRAQLDWQFAMGVDEAVAADPKQEWHSPAANTTANTSANTSAKPQQTRPSTPSQPANTPDVSPDFAKAKTLAELRDMCLGFKAAEYLKQTATQLVFADGNPKADLMLIGEAPGADEDRQGKPFVGASGQLLDKMLASIGITRAESAYITNIVLWRPPGNRTPSAEEITLFLPIVRRHIALIKPKVIMCVGKIPTQALLQKTVSILKTRGVWHEYDDGTPLMPSLHPAYLLRSPTQKAKAWQDLRLVYAKLGELTK